MHLMGRVNFPVKALIIALAFLVPLTWLAWSFYSTQNANIDFSAKERLGVEYNRAVFPVLRAAQDLRRDAVTQATTGQAPPTLADSQARLKAAQDQLAAVEQKLGAELGTGKVYADMRTAASAAMAATGAPAAVFQAHVAHVQAVLAVLFQATDGSNLTLDPDIDSYYLMDAAFFRMPEITEAVGLTRGLGNKVLRAGAMEPEERKLFLQQSAFARYLFSALNAGLPKSYAANTELVGKVRADEAQRATESFLLLSEKTFDKSIDAPAPDVATAFVAQANQVLDAQYQLADRLMTELDALLVKRIDGMTSKRMWTTVVLVVGLLFAAYAFYSFYLVANGGLRELAGHLLELADGDLRHPPGQQWATDETAHLLQRLGDTYGALKELTRKVRHGARELHTASHEIAMASADLAARTEASAAALEQQASAMEQIGSTVGNTASTAQEASDFSSRNAQVADRAGDTIRQVVATMQDIHASSSKINDIIGVIDGIAFQTNILALNAAVEAARAGDAGRGFAVVAAEVRGLAQRSANAAKEIKSLISTSVEKIDGGTRIVQSAGAVMEEVVSNARQVNTLLAEIATSSREQASGVDQVGQSIQELDRSTQQNAALVEETTAAASALRAEADKLQEEIKSFRVA
jgi:methyl-accepting chemotaxis protein